MHCDDILFDSGSYQLLSDEGMLSEYPTNDTLIPDWACIGHITLYQPC